MEISDSDLKVAIKNMMKATNKSAEELFSYNFIYFGTKALGRLNLSDITMSFKICEGKELAELLGNITARCGRDVNFIHGRDLGCYIRWTCIGSVGDAGRSQPIVIYTPIILDKRSAFLLMNKNLTVESSGKYCAPRYDMPMFEFRGGKIDRLVINNNSPEDTKLVRFNTGLDKIYWATCIQGVPDRELANLRKTGNLLKHDLYLDYRIENIAADDFEAMQSRNKIADEAILFAARKQLDNVLSYSLKQDIKPWLDIKASMENAMKTDFYKNVYMRQKKFDAKITTHLGQIRVASFYSQFIAAVYADAFIHQHVDEVPDALEKLNFPNHRIPLRCCCANCMTTERKRGPQEKVDKLYYTDEYTAAQVNVTAIS